jgi:hypothetical protein
VEPAEIEKSVGDLEVAVDRLRSLYEQYFMGIEKLEPSVPRKDVDRRIHALRKEQIRNTAMRFRFQMILQRYNVYQTHWQRICREIENGTYKRHMLKAERRFGEDTSTRRRSVLPAPNAKPVRDIAKELAELDAEFAPPEELDDTDLTLEEEPAPAPAAPRVSVPTPAAASAVPAQRKAPMWRKVEPAAPRHSSSPPLRPALASPPAPAAPSRAAAPAPAPAPVRAPAPAPARAPVAAAPRPPTTGEDLPEARVRQIYAQYVEAKRRGNESTAAITYEAVAKSLRESSAKLREKHGKPVDFEVAVKDGRAILKPVIK